MLHHRNALNMPRMFCNRFLPCVGLVDFCGTKKAAREFFLKKKFFSRVYHHVNLVHFWLHNQLFLTVVERCQFDDRHYKGSKKLDLAARLLAYLFGAFLRNLRKEAGLNLLFYIPFL